MTVCSPPLAFLIWLLAKQLPPIQTPDGVIKMFRDRYFVCGGLQDITFNSFDPVVSWTTACLFLVIALFLSGEAC